MKKYKFYSCNYLMKDNAHKKFVTKIILKQKMVIKKTPEFFSIIAHFKNFKHSPFSGTGLACSKMNKRKRQKCILKIYPLNLTNV